ncbi:hypothetical protein BABINDRAFT_92323 [Babjeviella inositovora NRRL Y-12698]|uniref:Uncharacterized protein n=1 Tax=Babjeviella inositovora NRRL Y-12698 TaxID=984486 RepID=A0A1E3QKS7_9ASCO|nr:uncharacterized protein BABINDRAFT_92323 [Babjeviella inositovora NRRL Y-12698]ODQ78064.1 hypothetical protein BABINDRAFT_92323 [Babjeviella inositovora NRRL Y-12698]
MQPTSAKNLIFCEEKPNWEGPPNHVHHIVACCRTAAYNHPPACAVFFFFRNRIPDNLNSKIWPANRRREVSHLPDTATCVLHRVYV